MKPQVKQKKRLTVWADAELVDYYRNYCLEVLRKTAASRIRELVLADATNSGWKKGGEDEVRD